MKKKLELNLLLFEILNSFINIQLVFQLILSVVRFYQSPQCLLSDSRDFFSTMEIIAKTNSLMCFQIFSMSEAAFRVVRKLRTTSQRFEPNTFRFTANSPFSISLDSPFH